MKTKEENQRITDNQYNKYVSKYVIKGNLYKMVTKSANAKSEAQVGR